MSSFKAKLFINGEERNLLFVEQEVKKYADITGKPNGKNGVPSILNFAIESTSNDSFFYHNMFSPNNMIDGEIVFYKRDGFSVLFKMEFANAHILSLREEFDHDNDQPLHMFLEIGWGIMRYKGVIIEKYWNPNNPWQEVTATTLNNQEPQVLECYYTDLDGNKEAEPLTGEEVFLVLKTQDAIGEMIDIDLSNHTKDFIYNDKIIEDDIIKDFEITADTQKIKLKVVVQQEGERELIKA